MRGGPAAAHAGNPPVNTSDDAPLCAICWRPVEVGGREGFVLKVVPIRHHVSEQSGRVVEEEMDFNLAGKLEGMDNLLWHYECLVDLLLDPSVVGRTY